jgi:mRNA-degrading endonuclease RelE of RelBE toxin-antitoxin system
VSWTVGLSSAAVRTLDQLPPRVLSAVIEFIYGPLAQNPHQVGKPLRDDFAGLHSAHRGTYRVLYEINESARAVTVIRVAHRADAYRRR